jgi:hypothetical protein
MNELISAEAFKWFLTVLTVALSAWSLSDVIKLIRMRGADPADPVVRDKRFGYTMGVVIGMIGMLGVLRFHGIV